MTIPLPTNKHRPGAPIDIIKLQRGDLARAQPQPRQ